MSTPLAPLMIRRDGGFYPRVYDTRVILVGMNKNEAEGKTKQVTGKVREEVGELTDNKTEQINGEVEQAEGKAREAVGKAQARRQDA